MQCKWCGKEINNGTCCCKEHEEKYKDYINKRDKSQGKMVFGFMGTMISYLIVMLIGYKLNINGSIANIKKE